VGRDEPRLWFPSLKSAAEILDRNKDLIRIIAEEHPESVKELARISGRAESNVSRSLKRLEACGIVRMVKTGKARRPEAIVRDFEIQLHC
jgi:predicted transcriptional regulator